MTKRLWRIFWLLVLVGHGLLAVAWWGLSPGGFGLVHPRFWSNRLAPPMVLGLSIVSMVALRQDRRAWLRLLLPVWPAAWAAGAIMLRIVFPITMERLWIVPLAVASAMGIAAVRPWQAPDERGWVGVLLAMIGASVAGAAAVGALRPPVAATHPRNAPLAPSNYCPGSSDRIPPGSVRFRLGGHGPDASTARSWSACAPLTISIQPFLTFLSRSPDGCPTVLVRGQERRGPQPRFREGRRSGEQSCVLFHDFPGQGPASLRVDVEPGTGAVKVDAATRLDQPVQSHLNAFCDVEVRGHRRLALAFSPCPDARIEVLPFDYPIGRPARFAFVETDRTFRVVEASSGEKGPFRTLAQGRLEPEQALTITLHDQERAVARLSLEDYAAQADTTPSPTAGWGVPVNAIEFSLADDSPSSPASIFVTLAGTSVGRGWDCVGHRAGTYRNRIRLEPVTANAQSRMRPERFSDGDVMRGVAVASTGLGSDILRGLGLAYGADRRADEVDPHPSRGVERRDRNGSRSPAA